MSIHLLSIFQETWFQNPLYLKYEDLPNATCHIPQGSSLLSMSNILIHGENFVACGPMIPTVV